MIMNDGEYKFSSGRLKMNIYCTSINPINIKFGNRITSEEYSINALAHAHVAWRKGASKKGSRSVYDNDDFVSE